MWGNFAMHELVIKNAKIVDGTGSAPFTADVAIDEGRISAVGKILTSGQQEIDATGLVLTPVSYTHLTLPTSDLV